MPAADNKSDLNIQYESVIELQRKEATRWVNDFISRYGIKKREFSLFFIGKQIISIKHWNSTSTTKLGSSPFHFQPYVIELMLDFLLMH